MKLLDMTQFGLDNKVAIITGGGSGIGFATAKAFLAAGVKGVTLTDISKENLQRCYDELHSQDKARVLLVTADASSEDDSRRYVAETVAKFGHLDISVQSGGIMQDRSTVQNTDADAFDKIMRINVRGPFLGIKHSIKAMLASSSKGKGCSIVVLSSQLGLDGGPGLAAYSATKFALRGLVLSAAEDLGHTGIRINAMAPGPINTPMLAKTPADMVPALTAKCVLGRLGQADEIANGILYLVSDAASYITGTTLKIDGGYSKWA